jgi:hypothetical protein
MTAWGQARHRQAGRASLYVRSTPKTDRKFNALAPVASGLTHAPQQTTARLQCLLDHLVGQREQPVGDFEAEQGWWGSAIG